MHRIDGEGHVGNMFADVDPSTATEGTVLTAAWGNAIQEELVAVVVDGGGTLNKAVNTQVRDALRAKFGRTWGRIIIANGGPSLQSGHNAASVAYQNSNTEILVTFTTALASNTYGVTFGAQLPSGNEAFTFASSVHNTGSFIIRARDCRGSTLPFPAANFATLGLSPAVLTFVIENFT